MSSHVHTAMVYNRLVTFDTCFLAKVNLSVYLHIYMTNDHLDLVKTLSVNCMEYFQGKVVVHSIPPYAMAWTNQHIAVAGPDKKVVFYTMDGMMAQQFDYFR